MQTWKSFGVISVRWGFNAWHAVYASLVSLCYFYSRHTTYMNFIGEPSIFQEVLALG